VFRRGKPPRIAIALCWLFLALICGCESHTDPENAEWIEIFNEALTAGGQANTHHITWVQIGRVGVGNSLPHFVDILPGESKVFSILWPGEHQISVRYDDGNAPSVQDPPDPFWVHNASTTAIQLWY
jgi:hypothetical protein